MRYTTLSAVLLIGTLAGTSPLRGQRIKLGTLAPHGTSFHESLLGMRDALRSCPDGGLRMTVYPGGVLGSEAAHVQKMRIGQINAALLTAAGLGEIDPAVNALQLMPMVFRSLEEVDYVRSRIAPDLEARLRDRGFHVLFWGDAGWVRFFTTEPALRPDDFRRLRIYVAAGSADQIDLMRNAGYQPVPLELSDALTGLRTGIVDAVPTLPIHALAAQFFTAANHMLELNWVPLAGAMVIRTNVWDRMSRGSRDCLQTAARNAGQEIQEQGRRENDEAVVAMQDKHGLIVHPVDSTLEEEWRRAASEYWSEVRGSLVPEDVFDRVMGLSEEFRVTHRSDKR